MKSTARRLAIRATLLGAAAGASLIAAAAGAQTQPQPDVTSGPGGQVPSPATQVDTAANPAAQVPQGIAEVERRL